MENMTASESLAVANTIRAQLGGALAMLGAKDLVGGESFLQFGIQGCKTVNKIRIELDPSDTYTVSFWKLNRKTWICSEVAEVDGVYVDSLHTVIENRTGLRTRL